MNNFNSNPTVLSETTQPQPTSQFSISDTISTGWSLAKKNLKFLVIMLVIVFLVNIFISAMGSYIPDRAILLSFFFSMGTSLVGIIMQIGIIKTVLNVYDNKEAGYAELFNNSSLLVNYFLGSLLYSLIVFAGLILFIIPGLIWAVKYQFYSYLIVDQKLKPMEAIKKSGEITKGVKLKLLGLVIVLFAINMAGLLALVAGLLITIPLSMLAMVHAYRVLLARSEVTPTQPEQNVANNYSHA